MITGVRSVMVFSHDLQAARQFWTERLGFENQEDALADPEEPPAGALEVRIPGDDVTVVLFDSEGHEDRVGGFRSLIFECDDIHATYAELVARGVEFPTPPTAESWGWWARFKDLDGNEFGLGSRAE